MKRKFNTNYELPFTNLGGNIETLLLLNATQNILMK